MISLSSTTRLISLFAGVGCATIGGTTGDGGPATAAKLTPFSITTDSSGTVYIGDVTTSRIRKVTATGTISLFGFYHVSGGVTTYNTYVQSPADLDVGANGDLYIADKDAQVVRMVSKSTGRDSIVAGWGIKGYWGDGGAGESGGVRNSLHV